MIEKKIDEYIAKRSGKLAGTIGKNITVELDIDGCYFSFKTCLGGEVMCENSIDITPIIDYRLRELGLID